jgi:hypothetical protein
MENTNPQPNDSPQPGDVRPPSLEVIHPDKSPQADKFQVLRDLWARHAPRVIALGSTLGGKVAIGAVAAAVAGGTIFHYAHRKPATPVISHVQVRQVAATHGHRIHKHVTAVHHAHKATKSTSKTTTTHKKTKSTSTKTSAKKHHTKTDPPLP